MERVVEVNRGRATVNRSYISRKIGISVDELDDRSRRGIDSNISKLKNDLSLIDEFKGAREGDGRDPLERFYIAFVNIVEQTEKDFGQRTFQNAVKEEDEELIIDAVVETVTYAIFVTCCLHEDLRDEIFFKIKEDIRDIFYQEV